MRRFRLSRREWMLFLFPCIILLFSHLDKLRYLNGGEVLASLNPFTYPRENARRTSCQSNLKQIALGIKQYTQDYDTRMPLNNVPTGGWVYGILPYTKSCPILHCPSSPAFPGIMIPDYWMNGNLNEKTGKRQGVSTKKIDRPDHTFLMSDGDGSKSSGNYTLDQKTWQSRAPYAGRHLLTANYSFVDGHVKFLRPQEVNAGRNLDSCCTLYAFKTEIIQTPGAKHEHEPGHEGHSHKD